MSMADRDGLAVSTCRLHAGSVVGADRRLEPPALLPWAAVYSRAFAQATHIRPPWGTHLSPDAMHLVRQILLAGTVVSGWRCPLCNATAYNQVQVPRADGTQYKTAFFECGACTVMFRHPARFARLGLPVRRWAADVEPRALREVHGFLIESKRE